MRVNLDHVIWCMPVCRRAVPSFHPCFIAQTDPVFDAVIIIIIVVQWIMVSTWAAVVLLNPIPVWFNGCLLSLPSLPKYMMVGHPAVVVALDERLVDSVSIPPRHQSRPT